MRAYNRREYHILLNAEKNKIEINGENIPVSGKIANKRWSVVHTDQELKDFRLCDKQSKSYGYTDKTGKIYNKSHFDGKAVFWTDTQLFADQSTKSRQF